MSQQYTSDLITCSKTKAMIETECTITLNGQKFTAGGSYIWPNKKTGKLEGLLYADISNNTEKLTYKLGLSIIEYGQKGTLSSWDGSLKIPALFLHEWMSSFGDKRQYVRFEYEGKKFFGIWYKGSYGISQIVRVREVKA